MGSVAVHSDLENFLCDWYRARLGSAPAYPGIVFSNVAPGPTEVWPAWLVVFRDDGGRRTSLLTAERSVGVTVYGGSRRVTLATAGLARSVFALAEQLAEAGPDTPVTALLDSISPSHVREDADRARFYGTLQLAVVATPL